MNNKLFAQALFWYDARLKEFYGSETQIDTKLLRKIYDNDMMRSRFIGVFLAWQDDSDITQIVKAIDSWLTQFAEYKGGYI